MISRCETINEHDALVRSMRLSLLTHDSALPFLEGFDPESGQLIVEMEAGPDASEEILQDDEFVRGMGIAIRQSKP